MRTHRNIFLAGIASLALVAGTGLALAQDAPEHNAQEHKGPAQATQPHAPQQMNRAPSGNTGHGATMGHSAQQENNRAPGARSENRMGHSAETGETNTNLKSQKSGQNAAEINRDAKGDKTRDRTDRSANTNMRDHGADRTAQDRAGRDGMRGLQANASGVNVRLNDEQRTQIRTTVIEARGAPRVDHVNFDVTVGTVVPRGSIHIVPVPATLVQIQPEWRGFLYFVYESEVIVVNPRNMRIAAVLVV